MSGQEPPTVSERRSSDPLIDRGGGANSGLKYVVIVLVTLALHGAVYGVGSTVSRMFAGDESEEDETVEVAIIEDEPEEPEPPPEPEPKPPEPEPEPKEPEPPEPEEEPKPEPDPEPEPEPEPEEKPEPVPEQKPPENSEPESMDPVHLDGLDMESTAEGSDGPAFKVGQGIEHGKITDKYVDPDRMDDIETGEGDGEGYGSSDTPGSGSTKNCKDRDPKAVERVRVDTEEYPLEAKRRGIEGTVVALLTVDKSGKVVDVSIKKSLGHGLDELAEGAFRRWTFKPARKDCKSVRATIRAVHEFRLQR